MAAMARRSREPRPPDRAATEAALERAALRLLERNGVLAGLNLREVADEAGVNRGLVYHYFGSRRDLLRAALGSDVRERMRDLKLGLPLRFRERYTRFVETMLRHRRAVVLSALLVLDGDRTIRMDPDRDNRRARFRRDIEVGDLPRDTDTEALYVSIASLIYGYAIFRTRLAEELEISQDELDDRVVHMAEQLIAGIQSSPGNDGDGDGDQDD
jgi:AcrR family transcriptional regulator